MKSRYYVKNPEVIRKANEKGAGDETNRRPHPQASGPVEIDDRTRLLQIKGQVKIISEMLAQIGEAI